MKRSRRILEDSSSEGTQPEIAAVSAAPQSASDDDHPLSASRPKAAKSASSSTVQEPRRRGGHSTPRPRKTHSAEDAGDADDAGDLDDDTPLFHRNQQRSSTQDSATGNPQTRRKQELVQAVSPPAGGVGGAGRRPARASAQRVQWRREPLPSSEGDSADATVSRPCWDACCLNP